jgi:hypothetical protein
LAWPNFCPGNLDELNVTASRKLQSAQHRPSINAECWVQAGLSGEDAIYGNLK